MSEGERLGKKVRALRRAEKMTQVRLAELLGISPSYLNLIEHDRRPLSAPLLIKIAHLFDLDLESFARQSNARLRSALHEVFSDPVFESHAVSNDDIDEISQTCPETARAVLHLYHTYQSARESAPTLASQVSQDMSLPGVDRSPLPSEQVSDFIQKNVNYFPLLEDAAEQLWDEAKLAPAEVYHGLASYLSEASGIEIEIISASKDGGAVRRFDTNANRLILSESLTRASRKFHLAHQIALNSHSDLLTRLADDPALTSDESRSLCRMALANYFAAAVLMPYEPFHEAARNNRYDVELLGNRFGISFEQVCHRLTTLNRPNGEGIPFHFVRSDLAGNISKQFSASGIQVSRYGGACPRWNLHTAFLTPGRICTQISQMPDDRTFFCIARTVTRSARGHHLPDAVYCIGLGCELRYAHDMIYADGIDLNNPQAVVPIGTSCRLCDRVDCQQCAFPSLQHPLDINENARGLSFYAPVPKGSHN